MKRISKFLSEYGIELMVSLYLLYSLYINRSGGIYGYVNAWYVINYSYGFGSRLLIGSIINLLTGGFVTNTFAYNFVLCTLVIISVLLGIVVGKVYKKLPDTKAKTAVLFLTVFYLMSPASPEYLWTWENLGRLETYLLLLSLVIILISFYVKNAYVKYISMALLGCLCVLIHQAYVFLFFSLMLVIMIDDIWRSKFARKNIFLAIFAVLSVSVMFLIMQFKSGIYYDDLDALMAELNSHADFVVDVGPMEAEYFWTIVENFTNNMVPEIPHHLKYGFILICMLIPLWGTYLWVWCHAINYSTIKSHKAKYILILLTNLAYIPVFALMNDWGRWFGALFTVGFLNIIVLAWQQDAGVLDSLKVLGTKIKENPMIFILFVLYISTFDKFLGLNFPDQVTDFYYTTYDIRCWIQSLF